MALRRPGREFLSTTRFFPLLAGFIAFSLVTGLLVAGVALPFVGTVGLTAKSASNHFEDLPSDFKTPALPQRTTIEASDGTPIAQIWNDFGNRVVEPLNKINPLMWKALVSIEDNQFFHEGPLDFRGTIRALVKDANAGGAAQGGSTLTQQYVKNVLLLEAGTNVNAQQAATADTATRKLQELKYAVAVSKKLSKDEILDRYLNLVPFGENAYGVEAAAERYFSTTAANLTLDQAATLAAVVNSPTYDDPLTHPQNALARRNIVLQKMVQSKYISAQQASAAEQQPIGTRPTNPNSGCISASGSSAFFCQYVEDEILNNPIYGKTKADRQSFLFSGLTIKTTMVPDAEKAADQAISDNVYPTDNIASAMAMIQPGTGQVEAIAQSRSMGSGTGQTYQDYAADTQHSGTSGFQAGSTFKAFVGLAALEQGITPDTQINSPDQLNSGPSMATCYDGQQGNYVWPSDWHPANETGDKPGNYTMTTAYWQSINTYFIQLEERTGICKPAQIAQSMGVTQDSDDGTGKALDQYGTFTLGTNPITPIEMADAYATIASRGIYCKPIVIQSVTSATGQHYQVPQADCHRVLAQGITDTLTSMLQGVVSQPQGTGHPAQADLGGRPAAGKTGTNDSLSMTWFDGYTPNLAAAVWSGNPSEPTQAQHNVWAHGRYIGMLYGESLSVPIWGQAMGQTMNAEGLPATPFATPAAADTTKPSNAPAPPAAGGGGNGGPTAGFMGGMIAGNNTGGGTAAGTTGLPNGGVGPGGTGNGNAGNGNGNGGNNPANGGLNGGFP